MGMKIIDYDIEKYNFKKLISDLYNCPLEELDSLGKKEKLDFGKDSHTSFHKIFYQKVDSGWPEFENLYESFVREVVFPMFEDDVLVYQKLPNIRFHCPDAKAVYKWHSDGNKELRHPRGEINIILPLTRCEESSTIWAESIPGLGDYQPLMMDHDQFFIGYLNACRHGNKVNETSDTRVSLDFRVVPGFAYDDSYPGRTATALMEFKVVQYYGKMERE